MFQIVLLFLFLAAMVATLFALIISVVVLLAIVAAIGIPLFLIWKSWQRNQRPRMNGYEVGSPVQGSVDRLKALYVAGKIDIFEFERRLEHLIGLEV